MKARVLLIEPDSGHAAHCRASLEAAGVEVVHVRSPGRARMHLNAATHGVFVDLGVVLVEDVGFADELRRSAVPAIGLSDTFIGAANRELAIRVDGLADLLERPAPVEELAAWARRIASLRPEPVVRTEPVARPLVASAPVPAVQGGQTIPPSVTPTGQTVAVPSPAPTISMPSDRVSGGFVPVPPSNASSNVASVARPGAIPRPTTGSQPAFARTSTLPPVPSGAPASAMAAAAPSAPAASVAPSAPAASSFFGEPPARMSGRPPATDAPPVGGVAFATTLSIEEGPAPPRPAAASAPPPRLSAAAANRGGTETPAAGADSASAMRLIDAAEVGDAGELSESHLAAVLAAAASRAHDGSLRLGRGSERAIVHFRDGFPIWARSTGVQGSLEEDLLSSGLITRSDASRASWAMDPEAGRRFGDALVELEILSAEDLRSLLGARIKRALEPFWESPSEGVYSFADDQVSVEDAYAPAVDVLDLAWEGMRHVAPIGPVMLALRPHVGRPVSWTSEPLSGADLKLTRRQSGMLELCRPSPASWWQSVLEDEELCRLVYSLRATGFVTFG